MNLISIGAYVVLGVTSLLIYPFYAYDQDAGGQSKPILKPYTFIALCFFLQGLPSLFLFIMHLTPNIKKQGLLLTKFF